jgi:hypothetical protein
LFTAALFQLFSTSLHAFGILLAQHSSDLQHGQNLGLPEFRAAKITARQAHTMAQQPRQAHPEGQTAVCYGKGGRYGTSFTTSTAAACLLPLLHLSLYWIGFVG